MKWRPVPGAVISVLRQGCWPDQFITKRSTDPVPCGRSITADPGRILFFSRDEPYRVSHPSDRGDHCIIFAPAAQLLADALAEFDPAAQDPDRPLSLTDAPADPSSFLLQTRIAQRLAAGDCEPMEAEEAACHLLHSVLAAAYSARSGRPPRRTRGTRGGSSGSQLATVQGASVPLPFGGKQRQIGEAQLERQLHDAGCRLLDEPRAVFGWDSLGASVRDLTRIALACGFYDHSHLTNAFRREFGRPPSAFRRELAAQIGNRLQVRPAPRPYLRPATIGRVPRACRKPQQRSQQ